MGGADGATHFLEGTGSATFWVADGAAGFLIPGKSGWPLISSQSPMAPNLLRKVDGPQSPESPMAPNLLRKVDGPQSRLALIIRHTPQVHDEIESLLGLLRK